MEWKINSKKEEQKYEAWGAERGSLNVEPLSQARNNFRCANNIIGRE